MTSILSMRCTDMYYSIYKEEHYAFIPKGLS